MIYNVRHILRILRWARYITRASVTHAGLLMIALIALVAYALMEDPSLKESTMDIAAIARAGGGFVGWVFIVLFWGYIISHVAPYIMRIRNWWVHSESHKITRKVFLYLWEGE